jgi:hypothetical protein
MLEELNIVGIFDLFRNKNNGKSQKAVALSSSVKVKTASPIIGKDEDNVISAERRIRTAYPSKNGLYPHELLVLFYADSFYVGQKDFQAFWWYQYGVKSVPEILSSLLARGFIEIGTAVDSLQKQKVADIKALLHEFSLPVTGKKADLIDRVVTNIPVEKLDKMCTKRNYVVTELGEQEKKENEYILYIHRHRVADEDIWSLNRLMHERNGRGYRDVLWSQMNVKAMEHAKRHDFGLYRNTRLEMYNFLKEEGKWNNAFDMFAEVAYLDLSGLGNGFNMQFLYIYAKSYFPYEKSLATLPPAAKIWISELKEHLNLDDEEFANKLKEAMERFHLPFHLFTIEECVNITIAEEKEDTKTLEEIYDKAEIRFKRNYPGIKTRR